MDFEEIENIPISIASMFIGLPLAFGFFILLAIGIALDSRNCKRNYENHRDSKVIAMDDPHRGKRFVKEK